MIDINNQLIIFSKNRASQLNLLLDSIKLNAPTKFDKISVLYKADDEYFKSYEILKEDYQFITFKEESNFRRDFINLINDDIEMTTLMVDDAVIYKPILARKVDILKRIGKPEDARELELKFWAY